MKSKKRVKEFLASAEGIKHVRHLRERTPSDTAEVLTILSGENLAAQVQEARRLLDAGDEAATVAYLLGRDVGDVRAVWGTATPEPTDG